MAENEQVKLSVALREDTAQNINQAIRQLNQSGQLESLTLRVQFQSQLAAAIAEAARQLASLAPEAESAGDRAGQMFWKAFEVAGQYTGLSERTADFIAELAEETHTEYGNLSKKANEVAEANQRAAASSSAFGRALAALRVAFAATTVSVVALQAAMSFGLSLAIAGIASGISHLIGKQKEHKQAQQELEKQNQALAETWTNQKESITGLVGEYTKLNELTKNGTSFSSPEEEQKYKDIVEQLSEAMPSLIDHVDEKGKTHLKNAEAIQRELEFAEKLTALENKKKIAGQPKEFGRQLKELKSLQDQIGNVQVDMFFAGKNNPILTDLEIQLLNLENQAANTADALKESLYEGVEAMSGIELSPQVSDNVRSLIDSLDFSKIKNGDALAKTTGGLSRMIGLLQQLKQAGSFGEAAKLDAEFLATAEAIKIPIEQANQLKLSFFALEEQQRSNAASTANAAMNYESLSAAIDASEQATANTLSGIGRLSSAYQTLQSGQSLSLDTMLGLIEEFPEFAAYLNDNNGVIRDKGQLLEQIANIERENRLNEKLALLESTKDTIASLEAKRLGYLGYFQMLSSTIPAQAMDQISLSMMSEEERKQYEEALKEKERLEAAIKELRKPIKFESSGGGGSGGSGSGATVRDPNVKDLTDASIQSINSASKQQDTKNAESQEKIVALENEKRYSEAVAASNELLRGQQKEIDFLSGANKKLSEERKKLDDSSKYDMSGWVDADGNETKAYINLYNSLSADGQEVLQKQYDKWLKLTLAIRENHKEMTAVKNEMAATKEQQDENKLLNTQAYFEKRNKAFQAYDEQLQRSEQVQSRYREGSSEWIAEEQNQIRILSEKREELQRENENIRARLALNEKASSSQKLTAEQVAFLNEQLKANSDAWYEADAAIRDNMNSLVDIQQAWADSVKSAAQETMGTLEEYYDKQNELEQDSLDRSLEDYEAYIDDRKKLLNRENEEEDFNKSREKLQKEEIELRRKIDVLKLDNSFEAIAKREDLEAELADKVAEIDELQLERSRDLREMNYDDQLESYRQEIQSSKDAAEQKWKDALQSDSTYSALREGMLQNNTAKMAETLEAFLDRVGPIMQEIGNLIDANLVDKLDLQLKFQELEAANSEVLGKNPNQSSAASASPAEIQAAWDVYLENKRKAEGIKDRKSDEFNRLRTSNDILRELYKFDDKAYAELIKSKTPVFKADTGGMTPAWGPEGKFLLAHEKELILNRFDTSNILKAVDLVRGITDRLSLPSLRTPLAAAAGAGQGSVYHIGVNVTVNGGDKNAGHRVADAISDAIRRKTF